MDAAATEHAGHRLVRLATHAAVAVAVLLTLAKLIAWLSTGSVALLSSLVDSLLDCLASSLNWLAVRHALSPPDREHRFGHAKAEPLAGLGQAVFVGGSAVFLLYEAANRLLHPAPLGQTGPGIAVMVLAIALTAALVVLQRRAIVATGSIAISADSLHYVGDLLANLAVIVALVLASKPGWLWLDPTMAACIAALILSSAWQIVTKACNQLMDRELSETERGRILSIAAGHAHVRAVHDLRTRKAGVRDFIQLHLEMDPQLPLIEAHRIADEVEQAILADFPRAEVIIHQDPAGLPEAHAMLARTP